MIGKRHLFAALSLAALAVGSGALADGYEVAAPAAVDEGRKFAYSFNVGVTSDYVFRGVSQSDNDPAIQGGADLSYGILYAGVWASLVDFADAPPANAEVDWYGGIKPTWGPLTFDFGIIYYSYPGNGPLPGVGPLVDLNYTEVKAGVSGSPFANATLGAIVYYSDDSFAKTGEVWTVEGTAAYTLHAIGPLTPTISGTVGHVEGDDPAYLLFNGFDSYNYWNAGVAFAVEKLTFDFRYWDTDAESLASSTLTCFSGYCDSRFVFSATVALP